MLKISHTNNLHPVNVDCSPCNKHSKSYVLLVSTSAYHACTSFVSLDGGLTCIYKTHYLQALKGWHYSERHQFWSSTTLNWLTPEFINEVIIEVCFKYFTQSVSIGSMDQCIWPRQKKGWPNQMNGEYDCEFPLSLCLYRAHAFSGCRVSSGLSD